MTCFGGRFVVCAVVLMVVSASALAQDRCCRRVSMSCDRPRETSSCVNHDADCFSTGASCAPTPTCCRPAPVCFGASTTSGCATAGSSVPAIQIVPLTDDIPRSLQDNAVPRKFYYLGDHPPYWGGRNLRGHDGR